MKNTSKNSKRDDGGALPRRFLIAAAAILTPSSFAASPYQITDLGTLGEPFSAAFALNNSGVAGGVSATTSASLHGIVRNESVMELQPLVGDSQSHVFAIMESGHAVVCSYDLGEIVARGFIQGDGSFTPLGNFSPRAANSAGTVVGSVKGNGANGWWSHAARWAGGTITELGSLGGNHSFAHDVNENGSIVGVASLSNELTRHAFLWISGQMRDLGTLGGGSSGAYAINNVGVVVGWAQTASSETHAFLFATDATGTVIARRDLGVLHGSSFAYAVNDEAQVVGTSAGKAVLWENDALIDLNAQIPAGGGWRLDAAWAINDNGQIAGAGTFRGLPRGFVLTPILPGDMNCNGVISVGDIAPFVLALTNPGVYPAQYPDCNILAGDLNGDRQVTVSDIGPFVALLTAG